MAAGDLTTLANVRQYLGTPDNVTTDDPLLERMISAISLFVQNWLNRQILQATYSEALDGHGTTRLNFSNTPVTAVASLAIDGVTVQPASGPPYFCGYVFNARQLSVYGYRFNAGYGNVQVTYTAGYATCPLDLEQAVIEQIVLRYKEKARMGQRSTSLQGAETQSWMVTDMLPSTLTVLKQYRLVVPV